MVKGSGGGGGGEGRAEINIFISRYSSLDQTNRRPAEKEIISMYRVWRTVLPQKKRQVSIVEYLEIKEDRPTNQASVYICVRVWR